MRYHNISSLRLRTGLGSVVLPGAVVSAGALSEQALKAFLDKGYLVAVIDTPPDDVLPEPEVTHTLADTPSVGGVEGEEGY